MFLEDALGYFSETLILCVLIGKILVFDHDHIDLSAVRSAGVQRDHAGTVVRTEIGVGAELGAFTLILAVAVGAVPVSAEDSFLFPAALRGIINDYFNFE